MTSFKSLGSEMATLLGWPTLMALCKKSSGSLGIATTTFSHGKLGSLSSPSSHKILKLECWLHPKVSKTLSYENSEKCSENCSPICPFCRLISSNLPASNRFFTCFSIVSRPSPHVVIRRDWTTDPFGKSSRKGFKLSSHCALITTLM